MKRFGNVNTVGGVSLEVPDGEFVVLLGPSGRGRTTTLRWIGGLENPDPGGIYIGDMLANVKKLPKCSTSSITWQESLADSAVVSNSASPFGELLSDSQRSS